MKLNFWIHGPIGSGKTFLANAIAGTDSITLLAATSTTDGLLRTLLNHKRVVLDNFREQRSSHYRILLSAALNLPVPPTGIQGRVSERKCFDLDLLVVVSEQPPLDAALRSRFHLISIEPSERLKRTANPSDH